MSARSDDADASGGHHVYETPWPLYGLAWSTSKKFRLALGSCIEHETNKVQIVDLNEDSKKFDLVAEVDHPFPATKLMWRPDDGQGTDANKTELLATTGTALRIWSVEEGNMKLKTTYVNTRTQQGAPGGPPVYPPLTSFDWSPTNPHKIGTSSMDTTCTIWNIEKQKIETQLIAHDRAVYDIAFSQSDNLFSSVGADGSVRLFDQRDLDHSTIIYENPSPLVRLSWNKLNTNHIATIAMDQVGVLVLDVRRPSVALATLSYQDACVNSVTWAPHSRSHLLCGTDDGFALIWDVKDAPSKSRDAAAAVSAHAESKRQSPLLAYECDHEVYQVQWPHSQDEYVALGTGRQVEVLQV